MDRMTDPKLPRGPLPPIPDGCGILPIAENRIAHLGPQLELLDAPPEVSLAAESASAPESALSESNLNDALEQHYRRVLARALALAACALLLAAVAAASLIHNSSLQQSFLGAQLLFRVVFVTQVLFLGVCSRYVERLAMAPAAVLLFAYSAFCALEFSVLLSPATLAVAFLCAALMYGATALWGYLARADLARPVTPIFMIVAGGMIMVAVNLLLRTPSFAWTLSALAVVIFARLVASHAQEIRDFYQNFDDDNVEGWKASVLGALLLLVNSVNLYLLTATFLGRFLNEKGERTGELR
jgi:FtsH-binding integral membrane protein